VNAKWWLTITEVSNEVDSLHWSAQVILTTMDGVGVCKICSTFADRWSKVLLEDSYKWIVWEVSAGHQLPGKVVIGDESLVFAYDCETKQESSEWHTTFSQQPKKFWPAKSNLKVMLIAFFREKASSIVNLCWRDNSVYHLLCSGWCHIYGTKWEKAT